MCPDTHPNRSFIPRTATRPHLVRLAFLTLLATTTATLLPACRPSPESTTAPIDVVAQVGARHVTSRDVADEIRRQGLTAQDAEHAQQLRRQILDALIDEESLVQQARAAKLDEDPEIQRRFRRWLVQEFRSRSLESSNTPTPPTEAELRQWYDAHVGEFTEPARARGRLIALRIPRGADPATRNAARSRLAEWESAIRSSAQPDAEFARLATEGSTDPATRRQGGDTGWIALGRLTRWPETVAETLLALPNPGDMSPILETDDALYLVRLTERRNPAPRPFEEVRQRVQHQVVTHTREQRERAFLAAARAAVGVRENPATLATVSVPSTTTTLSQAPLTPPSLPAQSPTAPETPTPSQP